MKTLKPLDSAAAPRASATTIAPAGAAFSASGTIRVAMPASFGIAITCDITLTGQVNADGAAASITDAAVGGSNPLCRLAEVRNLPWTLTPTSTTKGTVSGVAFAALGSECGPGTIDTDWNNASNTLSASNQPLAGNCTIKSLSVNPNPAFKVSA